MIDQSDHFLHNDFQFLEDMATACWYSELLFTAIELELFAHIEKGTNNLDTLADAAGCKQPELLCLLKVLTSIELVHENKGTWHNSQSARKFLVPDSPDYMGDFFMYRCYIQPQWKALTQKISCSDRPRKKFLSKDDDYKVRNFHYVRSLNQLAQQKAFEIASLVSDFPWKGPILDIGGGAGAIGREIAKSENTEMAVLLEIYEVIQAAKKIYPLNSKWESKWNQVQAVAGDFRFHCFKENSFGMIIMSNFLHTYNPETARELLSQALKLLKQDGIMLIHDYFPDRKGRSPHKGVFYDLNMMLNTCEGRCHNSLEIETWLADDLMKNVQTYDLKTDTSIIISSKD